MSINRPHSSIQCQRWGVCLQNKTRKPGKTRLQDATHGPSSDDSPSPMYTLLATILLIAFSRYFAPRIIPGIRSPKSNHLNRQAGMAMPQKALPSIGTSGSAKMNGKQHSKPDEGCTAMEPNRRDNRAQPWRAHWPPKEGTAVDPAYGFKKGEIIKI